MRALTTLHLLDDGADVILELGFPTEGFHDL
jgi:hypothetical protein